jgi:hypothetical protein
MPCGSGGFWGVCAKSIDEQMSAIRQPDMYVLGDIEKLDDDLKVIRDQGNFMKIRTALPTVNERSSALLVQVEKLSFTPPLQRGVSALASAWKPFKRFPILFAVPTPG